MMADERWYVIVDADGNPVSMASIDLDDPDTAIDEATGMPYSKSNERNPMFGRIATPARLAERGYSCVEALDEGGQRINPQEPPRGDPGGRYFWDGAKFMTVSGAGVRLREHSALVTRLDALEADMVARGETVPARSSRG